MGDTVDLNFVTSDVLGGEWLQWADSFTDVEDLVDQVIAGLGPGDKIGRLVIAGHGAEKTTGFFVFDPDTTGSELIDGSVKRGVFVGPVAEQLGRLAPYFDSTEGVVEFRVCEAGTGANGARFVESVANVVGVPVTAPTDEIKSLGLVGGLTTHWRTGYPGSTGRATTETFTRGGGLGPRLSGGADIAPVTGATVPLPGITNAPFAPAQPAGTPGSSIAPISSGTTTWRRPVVIGAAATTLVVGGVTLLGGGDTVGTQGTVTTAPSTTTSSAPPVSSGEPATSSVQLPGGSLADVSQALTGTAMEAFAEMFTGLDTDNPFTHSNGQLKATAQGEVDIVGAMSFGMSIDEQMANDLFGPDGTLPCGEWILCPTSGDLPVGDVQVIGFQVSAEPPAKFDGLQYQYGVVFDVDGDTTNNYEASSSFPNDTFDDTDRWYQVVLGDAYGAPAWELRVDDASGGSPRPADSTAVMIQQGDAFVLVVQESEVPPSATHRLTSFRHMGDFGMQPPNDFSGDVFPLVGEPLAPLSGIRIP